MLYSLIYHQFTREKITGTKTDSYGIFLMENVAIFSPLGTHSEYLARFYDSATFKCKIHVNFFLVLKPNEPEGTFQKQNLENFSKY